jgi:hypothetical protein
MNQLNVCLRYFHQTEYGQNPEEGFHETYLMLLAAVVVMFGLAYEHDAAAEEQPIAQTTVSVTCGLPPETATDERMPGIEIMEM